MLCYTEPKELQLFQPTIDQSCHRWDTSIVYNSKYRSNHRYYAEMHLNELFFIFVLLHSSATHHTIRCIIHQSLRLELSLQLRQLFQLSMVQVTFHMLHHSQQIHRSIPTDQLCRLHHRQDWPHDTMLSKSEYSSKLNENCFRYY